MKPKTRRTASEWLLAACGVWLVGLGLYFVFVRPPLLPEDPRYIGLELAAIQTAVPGLGRWLGKVFTVMGGFIAGAGALTAYLGWSVMPLRPRGLAVALAAAGVVTVGLMSAVNFAIGSDFRWLLVAPAAAWAAGLLLYIGSGQR